MIEEGRAAELFCHFVVEESNNSTGSIHKKDWIIGGMAAIHSVAVRNKWAEYDDVYLKSLCPICCY